MIGNNTWTVTLWCSIALLAVSPKVILPPDSKRTAPLSKRLLLPAAYLSLVSIAIFVQRAPTLSFPGFLNPDEAQMTAQALVFLKNPVPWKAYDGGTGGPLLTALIAIPGLFGFAPTFVSSRFCGMLLNIATILALYALLRSLYDDAVARLGILLPAAFYAFATATNFVHYSSEQLPVFLVTLSLLLVARLYGSTGRVPVLQLLATGIVVGALPFTKLQLVPAAAFSALLALVATLFAKNTSKDLRIRDAAVLVAGFVLPTAFFIVLAAATGSLGDAFASYVLFALKYGAYMRDRPPEPLVYWREQYFLVFLANAILVAILVGASYIAYGREAQGQVFRRDRVLLSLAAVNACLAVYMLAAPGTGYPHYALLAIVPAALVVSALIGMLSHSMVAASKNAWALAAGVVAAASLGVLVMYRLAVGNPFVTADIGKLIPQSTDVAAVLRRYVHPGDTLALWGWMPQFAVDTRAVLGTRDAVTYGQISRSSLQGYYRARYMRDMRANEPVFILDAVAPDSFIYDSHKSQGLESFPELWQYVERHYHLVVSADGVRLFKRAIDSAAAGSQ